MRQPLLLLPLAALTACGPTLDGRLRALRGFPVTALAPLGQPAAQPVEGHRILQWQRREMGTENVSRSVPVTVTENGRRVTRYVTVQLPVPVERRCRIRALVDGQGTIVMADTDEENNGCATARIALAN